MVTVILEKSNYKKIEKHLYSYFDDAEQLEIKQEDIILGCKTRHLGDETGGSMSNSNINKVEQSALQLAELKESEQYKWVKTIEGVVEEFKGTEYEKLIDLTYNKQYQLPKIFRLLNIERTGYYDRKTDVIMQIALKAARYGLIDNKVKRG